MIRFAAGKVNSPNMLAWALAYAAAGYRVLPLDGKIPRNMNGSRGATTDEAPVRRWWDLWPHADVGIATGNGLLVLDVDRRHGGHISLEELEAEHGPIVAPTVRTGNGLHLYMAGDLPGRAGFRPGLDLKSSGGYVVCPPSLHRETGRRYEWIGLDDWPPVPPPVPAWLAALVQPPVTPSAALPPRLGHNGAVPARYVQAAIMAECVEVASAPEGRRNDTLNRATYALARFVASGDAEEGGIVLALTAAARSAGLTDREILRTIESALGARKAAA